MRNIKLVLEYDGTHFLGFQKQKRGRTVQRELEKALFRILRERVRVIPAGRTDSGVHARAQAVNFQTRKTIPLSNLERALNTYLPEDVAVKEAREVPPDFHARFGAKRKIYVYRVLHAQVNRPLSRHYACHYTHPLDIPLMKKAASILVGKRDFRSFQAHAGDEKNSVRTLYRLAVAGKKPWIIFTFEGDGFLYNMVRNIVGTLLYLGRGKITLEQFKKIAKAGDRRLAGPTAPPQGLTLEKVIYEK